MNLKAADAEQLIAWETTNPVANADLAALRRTGDYQAVSLQDEHAIDGQAEVARRRILLPASQNLRDLRAELVQSLAGHERERDHRRVLQGCPRGQRLDFLLDFGDSRCRRQIDLRDHEDRAVDAKQMEDVEMLLGLRHHAIVGRDGEEHEIEAVRSGQHVADEALVSGNIDDAGAGPVRKIQMRESQIDRDAPVFFFLQPVRVLSRQGFDETRLAVVDMSGSTDDVGHGYFGMRSAGSKMVLKSRRNLPSLMRPMIGGRALRNRSAT